jgi:hypothetical protein
LSLLVRRAGEEECDAVVAVLNAYPSGVFAFK